MERAELVCETGRIIENSAVGQNLYVMRIESPRIAQTVQPGQFIHLRVPGMEDHILRRPFSIYDVVVSSGYLDVLYQERGFGSRHMTHLVANQLVDNIGPVGRGWSLPQDITRVLIVGGGVGAAPLLMQTRALVSAGVVVDVVLGAQTKNTLVTLERFEATGAHIHVATDDGSSGVAGFCTIPAAELLAAHHYDLVACCGPEPLMRRIADAAHQAGVSCEVSLERRMACGVGACLSCVVETSKGRQRACVDGPIFNAREVVWS